ncbi:unnamed protein product [Clonostachys chloroleuca]|uniref:Uncharacterized protein n=1 Tax=Clonostachys chloroleuca TaxID=1926264 RepID=A0AA35MD33_9HYPO|nr:unnamed protein product [Clonostachys chloroleuca]
MTRHDMESPEKRVRCPGEKCPRERCPALFSFEFLLDQNTALYDFKLFVTLWQKEYVNESLKANPDYEVCPFCYYIDNFEGLPKHDHPLLKCESEVYGKLSCRLCRSLTHEGKTCQEAKMLDLAEDVEEQTRQLTQLLNGAVKSESSSRAGAIRSGGRAITISVTTVARKKAEDALKKSLTNSGSLHARAIQLRDDYAQ